MKEKVFEVFLRMESEHSVLVAQQPVIRVFRSGFRVGGRPLLSDLTPCRPQEFPFGTFEEIHFKASQP